MIDGVTEISTGDLANLMQAVGMGESEKLNLPQEHLEVWCNSVPVARLAWEEERQDHRVVAIACTSGSHGVMDPKWKDIGERLQRLAQRLPKRKCQLCNGTKWIPADSKAAKLVAVLSGSLKMYRGVVYTPTEKFAKFAEKMASLSLVELL